MRANVDLERRLGSLALGILVLGVVYGFAVLASNDVRLSYAIGAILLFCGGMWIKQTGARIFHPYARDVIGKLKAAICLVERPESFQFILVNRLHRNCAMGHYHHLTKRAFSN
jgi:hypothetical protein